MAKEENPIYIYFTTTSTGNAFESESSTIIEYPFEKFVVKIQLDQQGRFIDILEIEEARDFRSPKQVLSSKNYFDVEKYAADESED